jgi:hypothetical protein
VRVLAVIGHANFDEPFRFCSGDPSEFETLVSNGETYIVFPFEITLLGDEDSEPEATIRIQNVDDRIGSTLIDLPTDSVSVALQIVMRETPDVVEYEVVNLELVDVEINAVAVSGRLVIRGLATEPCPGRVLTNRISPVFFR